MAFLCGQRVSTLLPNGFNKSFVAHCASKKLRLSSLAKQAVTNLIGPLKGDRQKVSSFACPLQLLSNETFHLAY